MVEQWITVRAAEQIFGVPPSTLRRMVKRGLVRVKRGPHQKSTHHVAKADLEALLIVPDGYMALRLAARKCGYNPMHVWRLVSAGKIEARRKGRLLMVKVDSLKAHAARVELTSRYKQVPFAKWLQASGLLEQKPIPTYDVIRKLAAADGFEVSNMIVWHTLKELKVKLYDARPSERARKWGMKNHTRFEGWSTREVYRVIVDETDIDIKPLNFKRVWGEVKRMVRKEFENDARNA